jgi:hypothetical protein
MAIQGGGKDVEEFSPPLNGQQFGPYPFINLACSSTCCQFFLLILIK